MPFENRGVEVGVTLHHPHGQIYAYPVIPPVAARELEEGRKYFERTGRGLLVTHIEAEISDGRRMIYQSEWMAAFVPVCARYPYEVWLAPRRQVGAISGFSDDEKDDFARALKTLLLKYDGLWQRPFPYIMVFHQAPAKSPDSPDAHFHVEFYPPYRTSDRLKYLAGTEVGAGLFANDSLPEQKAGELQRVAVSV